MNHLIISSRFSRLRDGFGAGPLTPGEIELCAGMDSEDSLPFPGDTSTDVDGAGLLTHVRPRGAG